MDYQPKPLPDRYHLSNFQILLNTVFDQYQDILNDAELQFRQQFLALPSAAQSLYVRLLTRSHSGTREDQIHYDDITNLGHCVQLLQQSQLIDINGCTDPVLLLSKITKAELVAFFELEISKQVRKVDLVAALLDQLDDKSISLRVYQHIRLLSTPHTQEFDTFRLCFFGNSHQDLSEFVITELGHVRYENYPISQHSRYYQNHQQIDTHKHYILAQEQLDSIDCKQNPQALIELAKSLPHPGNHLALKRRYQNLVNNIARQLERLAQLEQALNLYRQTDQHPSRERQARILKQLGQPEAALAICQQIVETGSHPQEQEFALTFGSRLAKQLKQSYANGTANKITEHALILQSSEQKSVEQLAAEAISVDNSQCFYVENSLFNSLFGLYFWDIIFAPIEGAFLNPFQRGPVNARSEFFYRDRQQLIEQRLNTIGNGCWKQSIEQCYAAKKGIANLFVHWRLLDENLIQLSLGKIPPPHLKAIFRTIAQHPGLYSNGFPDLIRFHDQGYELIEVKAPGDVMQANQKRWFKRFSQFQVPASLLKIQWRNQGAKLD